MRVLLLTALACCIFVATFAQEPVSVASQSIQLTLNPVISLKFTNASSGNGPSVNLSFNTMGDYLDGVESATQELEVRSNKHFKISVKTDAPNFTYSGQAGNGNASIPVANTLFMAVTNNATGGTLTAGFDSYVSLSPNSQDVILDGTQGEDKKLTVAYKAKPDIDFPAGVYTVGVVYTATQP